MSDSRRLGALYDALDFFSSLREPEPAKIWVRVLEKTAACMNARSAAYLVYQPVAKALVRAFLLGEGPVKAARPVLAGAGFAGWTAKFHEPLLADSSSDDRFSDADDRLPGAPEGPLSVLIVPLFVGLDFIGVFEFCNPADKPFTEEDLRLARTLASHGSLAIRRLQLENMVNRVTTYNASILDNLSGGFLAVDLLGRVMICNPAAKRILEVQGEVIDVAVEKALAHIPDLASVLRDALSSKKTVKREELGWDSAGQRRLLGYSTLLIKDSHGAFAGAGITFQDITNLKK